LVGFWLLGEQKPKPKVKPNTPLDLSELFETSFMFLVCSTCS
jgi:hypothetical protein